MKPQLSRFLVSTLLLTILLFLTTVPEQQAQKPVRQLVEEHFALRQTEAGVTAHELTPAESAYFHANEFSPVAHELHPLALPHKLRQQQTGVRIEVQVTQQANAYPQASAAFQRAAQQWEAMLETYAPDGFTPVTVRLNFDFGAALFGASYAAPDIIGVTSVGSSSSSYEQTLEALDKVSSRPQQRSIYSLLPRPRLLTDMGPTQAIIFPAPLGQALFGNEFAALVSHRIGFNAQNKFDFDPSDGIDPDKFDFQALALREIGRILGFTSAVGRSERAPVPIGNEEDLTLATLWDFYRLPPNTDMDNFALLNRRLLSGGEQVFFAGGAELPLDNGASGANATNFGVIGHWRDDAQTGQYIGIMDANYAPGDRGFITANDLLTLSLFGHRLRTGLNVRAVASLDDNSAEEVFKPVTPVLNQFALTRYPAQIEAVRVYLPNGLDGSTPHGRALNLKLFATPKNTLPTPAMTPLAELNLTIPAELPASRWLEVMLPNPLMIQSGTVNLVLSGDVWLGADRTTPQARSFSADGTLLKGSQMAPVNLLARLVAQAKLDQTPTPELLSLNPMRVEAGRAGLTVHVYGRHFQGNEDSDIQANSYVKWNGRERPTYYLNGSTMRVEIPAEDLTREGKATLTVFTPHRDGGIESAPLEITIGSGALTPVLLHSEPPGGIVGSSKLDMHLRGRNFTPKSVVQFNNSARITRFVSSVELVATLTASDLASTANAQIAVLTPGLIAEQGANLSNILTFEITPCHLNLSPNTQPAGSVSSYKGVLITANHPACAWVANTDVGWIDLRRGNQGRGQGFLMYEVDHNVTAAGRTGVITIGDQQVRVRQSGRAATVSAASFSAPLAPESIATIFGENLAFTTATATGGELPFALGDVRLQYNDPRGAAGPSGNTRLLFVSPTQINFLVPSKANNGTATLQVNASSNGSNFSTVSTVTIAAVAPGLFAANGNGQGVAAALVLRISPDGAQRYEPATIFDTTLSRHVPRPIDLGTADEQVILLLFGTGLRGRSSLDNTLLQFGELEVKPLFAGAQAQLIGLDQINVQLPRSLKGRGEIEVTCQVDRKTSNSVKVAIK